jgi:hypothetical protein
MINVEEHEDGSFTVSWDENDPEESIFNTWRKQDFIDYLTARVNEEKSIEEYCGKNSEESGEESRKSNNISEATEKDWQDFYESESEGKETFGIKGDQLS